MQIPTCSLLVQIWCWMQNRYPKLTAKRRLWVRSTRVHHDTRTRQQPQAAGCLQEHWLSPSSFLPPSRNKLPDSLSFCAGFALPQFRLMIHSRVTGTQWSLSCVGCDPDSAVGDCWSCSDADPYSRRGGTEGALGCSKLILFKTEWVYGKLGR